MSDVVEKTLTALPSLLALDSTQQPSSGGKLSSASKLGQLIRAITELTSKHEEEKLMKRELVSIKDQVSSPNTSMRQMKELMVRAIYCEMLGYQASFSYIHAIKLAQQGNVLEKRVGYLAVSLCLHEGHELLLLLVNTVLKDLQSTNLIEVCMALTVVSQMFPKDMIPAILPLVEEKLTHPKEIIRRKAVLALYKFYLVAPNQVQHIHNKFRKALCDKDPGVMSASLHIYLQMIQENPEGYKELTGSFVTILKQVVGGRLPLDFNYHTVPGPWLQIQLLTILALLGKNDHNTSQMMYEVLDESLQRAEMNHNITYAILYECVKAIYTIHPKSDLLEKAAKCIGNFVLSPKINLKYLGLKALTYVVQQDVNLALQHQMTIIECLDHSDVIIKRETLELLYRITNEQNVVVIVEKMLDFLHLCKDEYTITDLVGKVAELAENTYAPDNSWFIETMNTVFTLGGDSMQPDIQNNFLRLLSDGADNMEDTELRLLAVDSYVSLLQGEVHTLPQRFLQVISWVLGEYSPLREGLQTATVVRLLLKLLDMKHSSGDTRIWALAAMCKLQREGPAGQGLEGLLQDVCESYASSLDTVLRQKVHELQLLSQDPELRARVLSPPRRHQEPLEVDSSLSFLDGFVSEALAAGAAPYKPPHQRQEELSQNKAVNMEPYSLSLSVSMSADRLSPTLRSVSSGLSGNSTELSHKGGCSGLRLDGVRRVWGREGYLEEAAVTGEEVPSPLQSPPAPPPGAGGAPGSPGGAAGSPDSAAGGGGGARGSTLLLLPGPQQEKKQQLASSLFVGLGSQSSVCLMGRSEPTPQRFRRKAKGQGSSSDSSHSSNSTLDHMDPRHAHPSVDPPPASDPRHAHPSEDPPPASDPRHAHPSLDHDAPQQSQSSLDTATTNGTCGGEELLHPITHSDPDTSKDQSLASQLPVDLAQLQRSAQDIRLPVDLSQLQRSDIVPLCSSQGGVSVSGCHVQGEDTLLLLLFLSNASDAHVHHVLLDITSTQLQVCSVCASPLGGVQAHSVEVCQYSLLMKTPAAHVELSGNISYQPAGGDLQSQSFAYTLSLADFIRPFPVSTEEYGSMWLSFSHDTRQNLSLCQDAQDPLTATLTLLRDKLQLHLVDIIGSEGIVACRLLQGQPCLMHCRIHGDSLAVWLRSPVPELPDCLLYHCQRVLTQDQS